MKPFVVLAGFSLDFVGIFDDPFPDVQKWLEIIGNGKKRREWVGNCTKLKGLKGHWQK